MAGRIQKPDRARSPGRSTCGGGARLENIRTVSVITPLRPGSGRGPFQARAVPLKNKIDLRGLGFYKDRQREGATANVVRSGRCVKSWQNANYYGFAH